MDGQELEYPTEWIAIHFQRSRDLLQQIDTILLSEAGRMWERERDLLPHKKATGHHWGYTVEELRTSRLGQVLLTIADCAAGNPLSSDDIHRAMKRAARTMYGDPQRDGYTLPPDFHTTALGRLFQQAYIHMYTRRDLLTAKQAYTLVGVVRQTLYERRDRGKLTKIYWHDEICFLRSEIEAWKAEREQRKQQASGIEK